MNEWEENEKVLGKIKIGKYEEYLAYIEKELLDLISIYDYKSFFALINYLIYAHNLNIQYKESKVEEYNRKLHISLKMILSLPAFYFDNVIKPGKKKVKDYEQELKKLLEILNKLEIIYYYYPVRNYGKDLFDDKEMFYLNYFRSFFFDYPDLKIHEYYNFFSQNSTLIKKELGDPQFDSNLKGIYLLQYFEQVRLKKHDFIRKIVLWIQKFEHPEYDILLLFPLILVRLLFNMSCISYKEFKKRYVNDLSVRRDSINCSILECMAKEKVKLAYVFKGYMFFPRNYFVLDCLYQKIWRSDSIGEDLTTGMTYKSDMHETLIGEILDNAFGIENVYKGKYLKRNDRAFVEKDFIVLCGEYVISLEAKAKLLPIPDFDYNDGLKILQKKYDAIINHAIKQSLEVKQAIKDNDAHFYDSNKKPYNEVIDLSSYNSEKILSIAVSYESFMNVGTNPEFLWNNESSKFWIVDVYSLKEILERTVCLGETDKFLKYVENRVKGYGVVNVQHGEEIRAFNLYCNIPVIFEMDARNTGISVHI